MLQGATQLPVPSRTSGQRGVPGRRRRDATGTDARSSHGRGHFAVLRISKRRGRRRSRSGPIVLSVAVRRRSSSGRVIRSVHNGGCW